MNQPTPTTPDNRSQEFVPVTGGPSETSSAEGLLFAAYVMMWAILMGFLLLTFRRQASVQRRLDELERSLSKRTPGV